MYFWYLICSVKNSFHAFGIRKSVSRTGQILPQTLASTQIHQHRKEEEKNEKENGTVVASLFNWISVATDHIWVRTSHIEMKTERHTFCFFSLNLISNWKRKSLEENFLISIEIYNLVKQLFAHRIEIIFSLSIFVVWWCFFSLFIGVRFLKF